MPANRRATRRAALLREVDRPAPRRRRALILLPVGAMAAAGVVAVTTVAGPVPRAAAALWAAVPDAADASVVGTDTPCINDMNIEIPGFKMDDVSTSALAHPSSGNPWRLALAERRGLTNGYLAVSEKSAVSCVARGDSWTGVFTPLDKGILVRVDKAGRPHYQAVPPLDANRRVVVLGTTVQDQWSSEDNGPIAGIMGAAAPEVDRVTVTTSEGTEVTASVDSGYFLAWWPQATTAEVVRAYDADGKLLTEAHPPVVVDEVGPDGVDDGSGPGGLGNGPASHSRASWH